MSEPILIIGAGITGAFTAYLTALEGLSVEIIAPEAECSVASRCNPGGINPLHGPGIPGPMQNFSLESYRLHQFHAPRIQRLSGIDFKPRVISRLMLACDDIEQHTLLAQQKLYQQASGFSARWLEAQELQALEPRLSPRAIGGLLTEGNLSLNAADYTEALLCAAKALGAVRVPGEVLGIEAGSKGVELTLKDGSRRRGAQALIATGPWQELVRPWLPRGLPLRPLKGELLQVELDQGFDFDVTRGLDALYHHSGAQYWLGGYSRDAGFDIQTEPDSAERMLSRVRDLIPGLGELRVLRQVAALRPATPDGLPLVDRLPGCDQILISTGAGGKGMLWSAGMAELGLALIQNRVASNPFALSRLGLQVLADLGASHG